MSSAETAYLFRHAVMRDTAYELQLPTVRAYLHTLVLRIMEDLHGGAPPAVRLRVGEELEAEPHPLDAFATEMAEHALRGQSLTGNLADLLRSQEHYLLRAAWRAEKDFRTDDALTLWLMLGELAKTSGNATRSAEYRCQASGAASHSGNAALAESLSREAIGDIDGHANPKLAGALLARLARAERELGRGALSFDTLQRAAKHFEITGDARQILNVRLSMALNLRASGHIAEAEAMNDEVARGGREIGAWRMVGNAIGNQVGVYMQTRRPALAMQAALDALAIHRQVGNRRSEGITLGNIASLKRAEGNVDEADQMFHDAIAINREVGDRASEGRTVSNLGNLYVARGDHDAAERCFSRAIGLLREIGAPSEEGVALGNYATLLMAMGRSSESGDAFRSALKIHRKVNNRRYEGAHAMDYSSCLLAQGHEQEARQAWQQGAAIVREIGDAGLLAEKTTEMQKACAKAGVPPFDKE